MASLLIEYLTEESNGFMTAGEIKKNIKVKYPQVYCCQAKEKSSWLGFSKIILKLHFIFNI